jgi:hypothetical protein
MAALRAAAGGGSGEGLNGSVMTHRARGDGASQAVSFGSAATATRWAAACGAGFGQAVGNRWMLPWSANHGMAPGDTMADQWAALVSGLLNLNKPEICFLTREKIDSKWDKIRKNSWM